MDGRRNSLRSELAVATVTVDVWGSQFFPYDLQDGGGGDDDVDRPNHGYHFHHAAFNTLAPERRRISVLEQQVEQQVGFRAWGSGFRVVQDPTERVSRIIGWVHLPFLCCMCL